MILWPMFTYRRLERPGQWRLSLRWQDRYARSVASRPFQARVWRYPEGTVYAVWLWILQVKLMVKA